MNFLIIIQVLFYIFSVDLFVLLEITYMFLYLTFLSLSFCVPGQSYHFILHLLWLCEYKIGMQLRGGFSNLIWDMENKWMSGSGCGFKLWNQMQISHGNKIYLCCIASVGPQVFLFIKTHSTQDRRSF